VEAIWSSDFSLRCRSACRFPNRAESSCRLLRETQQEQSRKCKGERQLRSDPRNEPGRRGSIASAAPAGMAEPKGRHDTGFVAIEKPIGGRYPAAAKGASLTMPAVDCSRVLLSAFPLSGVAVGSPLKSAV